MITPLDEFPLHQAPLPIHEPASSDRNFYDRCYLNAHDRTGEIFMITGFGVYPNLGVADAYLTVGRGTTYRTVRFSDAMTPDRMNQSVGGYRIEVIDPLSSLRVICDEGDEQHEAAVAPHESRVALHHAVVDDVGVDRGQRERGEGLDEL